MKRYLVTILMDRLGSVEARPIIEALPRSDRESQLRVLASFLGWEGAMELVEEAGQPWVRPSDIGRSEEFEEASSLLIDNDDKPIQRHTRHQLEIMINGSIKALFMACGAADVE